MLARGIRQLPPVHVETSRSSGQSWANVGRGDPRIVLSSAMRFGVLHDSCELTAARTSADNSSARENVPSVISRRSAARLTSRTESSLTSVDGFAHAICVMFG